MKFVSVGDKVEEGQALVKYSGADAQAAYDAADRAVAKADRHIEELNKARENASATLASSQVPTEAGLPEQAQAATSSVSSIDSQISDAKDNRADAVAQLNKAQAQLDAATPQYTRRTVVEVNRNASNRQQVIVKW